MGINKLLKKIEKQFIKQFDLGYEEGYDDGWTSGYGDGIEEGVSDGIQLERDRWKAILEQNIEWAMESGKGSKAVMYREVLETLSIQIDMEKARENYERDLNM